jgi:hypothetical protein
MLVMLLFGMIFIALAVDPPLKFESLSLNGSGGGLLALFHTVEITSVEVLVVFQGFLLHRHHFLIVFSPQKILQFVCREVFKRVTLK